MYRLEKQVVISARATDKSHVKVNRKKEALQKLAQYLRNERNYSEKEIKKFMAESFVGKIDY